MVSFVVLALLQMQGFADDPGVGWHLKTGEWIVEHQSVPVMEPFLFSLDKRAWRADQWLSDLLIFLTYQRGSWAALYAAFSAIFLLTFWGPLYTFVVRRKVCSVAALISVFLTQRLASIHFVLRPVLLSFLMFAVSFVLILRAFEGACRGESQSKKRIIGCAALFALWANIHPSFVLGLVALVVAILALPLELARREKKSTLWVGLLGLGALGAVVFGTFINPYGIELYQTHIDHLLRGGATSEWLPLALNSAEGDLFLGLLFVIGGGAIISSSIRDKISVFEGALLLLFAALTLNGVRFLPYFAIVACAPLAIALTEISSWLGAKARALLSLRLIAIGERVEAFCKRREAGGFCVFLSAATLALWGVLAQSVPLYGIIGQSVYGPSRSRQPIEMIEYLAKEVQSIEPAGVLADPNWGGAVTWYGGGRLKPVLDDRENLNQDYDRFFTLMRSGDDRAFKKYAQDASVHYSLIRANEPLGAKLADSEDFEVLKRDSLAILVRVR
jgi:hypothetical protein